MALKLQTKFTRVILAWDEDGTFRGGQADEVDLVIDDEDGSEVARRERVAQPIAGALQPGEPLSQLFTRTEQQRLDTMQTEKDRADAAEAARDKLRLQVEDLGGEPVA